MKLFLFLSAFFHAVVLLLLFSWEIPLANRLLPRSFVEVSLVEEIETKQEGKKNEGNKQAKQVPLKKVDSLGKESEGETRRVALAQEGKKIEEPKQKNETIPAEAKEEKPWLEEKVLSEDRIIRTRSEKPPVEEATIGALATASGAPKEIAAAAKSLGSTGGKADAGSTFLVSSTSESGKEGISLDGGEKGSGPGRGEGGPSRLSSIPKSSGEGDPVLAAIMRRIEAAKRYPRMAQKMGIEGQAAVRFKLKPNGKVEAVELVESSGSDILDQASIETVQRAAPLPYKDGWLKVVIVFKIL
jgi:TonB family protein